MENSAIETATAAEARACFTIDGAELKAAAKLLASKVIERRNTVPILATIHVAADVAGTVTLTGTDLDLLASITLAADVQSPGPFCVEAEALSDLLGKLPKGKNAPLVTIEHTDAGRAVVKCGRSRANLFAQPTGDFPLCPTDETEGDTPLSHSFAMPAGAFLADLKALAPAMSSEETRFYLNGVALQRIEGEAGERLAMVATDGHCMVIARRDVPEGAGEMPDCIVPRKAVQVLLAAAKIEGEAGPIACTYAEGRMPMAFDLGRFTLRTKLVDGTFPDWQRVAGQFTVKADADAPLFPDLLPGAPTAQMERLAKAAPGAVTWEHAGRAMLGTVAGDDGLDLLAMRMAGFQCDKRGFEFHMDGHAEAQAYLVALAESAGLPSADAIAARCSVINAEWEAREALLPPFCGGDYCTNGTEHGRAEAMAPLLCYAGGRVVGLTIAGEQYRSTWFEDVEDWETLSERRERHEGGVEAIEGSYSILMPADGPQLEPRDYIDGPDGHRYPVAVNESTAKIHLSAEQVRALIGESCFETLEFPGSDGKPRYVARWLWDDGATRFLIVGKDGRGPKRLDAWREYVTREEIEAALAGEPVAVEAAPIVEAESEGAIADIGEPRRGEVSPGPLWKGEPWADVLRECARSSVTAFECVDGVVSMVANERNGNFRTRIPVRWQPIALALFNAQAREYVRTDCADRWASLPYYGPAAPNAVQDASEPAAAATPAPESENTLHGPENGENGQAEAPADPTAAILARLEALEAAIASAPLPVEREAAAIRGKRTPAHERAVRRAWAERAHRRLAVAQRNGLIEAGNRKAKDLQRAIDAKGIAEHKRRRTLKLALAHRKARQQAEFAANARAAETADVSRQLDAAKWETARVNAKRRRNAMLARKRTAEMVAAVNHMHDQADGLRQRNAVLETELAKMKADMADPSQPERASDLAQLVRERDEARNASAALQDRCKRAERARDGLADAVEGMGVRLANAEAAVRRLADAA